MIHLNHKAGILLSYREIFIFQNIPALQGWIKMGAGPTPPPPPHLKKYEIKASRAHGMKDTTKKQLNK